jgi:hypothetical protein
MAATSEQRKHNPNIMGLLLHLFEGAEEFLTLDHIVHRIQAHNLYIETWLIVVNLISDLAFHNPFRVRGLGKVAIIQILVLVLSKDIICSRSSKQRHDLVIEYGYPGGRRVISKMCDQQSWYF